MHHNTNTPEEANYWSNRYENAQTGWDIGYPAPALKAYVDQLTSKDLRILIPGAGNAYEAEYLHQEGFQHVRVLDITPEPLHAFAQRVPSFPKENLVQANFFEHQSQYDLILEQTFFCSFVPTRENRERYVQHMHQSLVPGGKLVGLWFDIPLTGDMEKRPFGGTKAEYLGYFEPYFEVKVLERCYNSIKPREGTEFFGLMVKK